MNFSRLSAFKYLLCLPLLSGCVSVLPSATTPSDKLSFSTLKKLETQPLAKSSKVISVNMPRTSDFRDTTRLVVFHEKSGAQLQDYIIGTEWVDRLPTAFQNVLVQSILKKGIFKGVVYQADAISSELMLITDIGAFDTIVNQTGQKYIILEITANLMRTSDRKLIDQKTFFQKEALEEKNLKGLQNTYNKALERLLQDLTIWVQEKS